MSIKAAAFDYGNVISEPQEAGALSMLAVIADVDESQMESFLWKNRGAYDRGTVTAGEYFTQGLKALGKDPDEGTIAALVRFDLESWATINSETAKLIEDCRAADLKIAIISNMPHEFLALARKRFPLFGSLDAGVYSCELGVNKPEKPIYDKLIADLGIEAAEIAYFDDIQENVDVGAAAGLRSWLWTSATEARRVLRDLGVDV